MTRQDHQEGACPRQDPAEGTKKKKVNTVSLHRNQAEGEKKKKVALQRDH